MEHLPDLISISGYVVMEGGGAPPVIVKVEANCSGGDFWSGSTDREGRFKFSAAVPWHDPSAACVIVATAPEYGRAATRIAVPESRTAVLTLHPLVPVEGATVSAISVQAPARAQKEFSKGIAEIRRQRWTKAQRHLEAATANYPRYAEAWYYLGLVFEARNDAARAGDSYHKAIAAGSGYVRAYAAWAALALRQEKWREAFDAAGEAIRFKPAVTPAVYYIHADAARALGRFAEVETSARRAVELDLDHRFPRAHYLLALALARRFEYRDALQNMRLYLKEQPDALDAALVEKQITDLERALPQPR